MNTIQRRNLVKIFDEFSPRPPPPNFQFASEATDYRVNMYR